MFGGVVGSGTWKLVNGGGFGARRDTPRLPRTTSSGRAAAMRSAVQYRAVAAPEPL